MKHFPEIKFFKHSEVEREILDWWLKEHIFERSLALREGGPEFTFYEGPPTANGKPGIHHVMARTIKDLFCRYRTMKGYHVERKAGWDTHGLPVEIEVEKALGLEGRRQVEEYGIEKFNAACRESVLKYKNLWDELTRRMGYWVDIEHPYITFENQYIETLWWIIKELYKKGLLYKGYKIQWYSPGTGTVLSSHEVSLGYKEVRDPSVFVRFPLDDEPRTSFLVWTTTPWTLISNVALAVGPDIDYVKVRVQREDEEEYLILAAERLEVLREEYEIVARWKGEALKGRSYTPPYAYFTDEIDKDSAWIVVTADFVSTEEGTGIVHIAPAFGAEDYAVAQEYGLPLVNPITPEGVFVDKIDLVAGMWFKEADKQIIRDLRQRGLLYRQEWYIHSYPHDWRKGTPLMSYPVESWFIRSTAVKDRMIALNREVNWQPPAIGEGRFGRWLENNVDWAISRNRYWGTPLPIWVSDKPGSAYFEVIGSIAELREKCGDQVPPDDELDLHRPYVDRFTWPAPDGGTMRRVPDLIDVWFDSGAMPYAQWHYPFENREKFEKHFPADFISEGVDQTRGWFYTLHALATMLFDSVAYRNVVVGGLVLDEKGEKMSKSKGNVVDPFAAIEKYGADPVRWYMISNAPPWENLKWSFKGLEETWRKFFHTLTNTYSFFATYANVDGFTYEENRIPVRERAELDRWIMSRLNTTTKQVDEALEAYHPTRAVRALEQLVDELSNWYVRRSRRRFWREGRGRDKEAAFQTMYEVLLTIAQLMSPFAPFYAEWLYRTLNGVTEKMEPVSVHLTDFPQVETEAIDRDLERRMQLARTISSLVLSLRNRVNINVRQPLPRILVVVGPKVAKDDIEQVKEIILDEVNVRTIEYVTTSSGLVKKSAKPNFKVLGKRLGPLMKPVNQMVRQLRTEDIEAYEASGHVRLTLPDGTEVELGPGDLEIISEGIEGWEVGQEEGVTVALDTTITEELRAEGLAREFINRVQHLRKKAGFEVTDRIRIETNAKGALAEAIRKHEKWIRNETLALALEFTESPRGEQVETFDIGGERVVIGVQRVNVPEEITIKQT